MRRIAIAVTFLLASAAFCADRPLNSDDSRALFNRFKAMEGTWKAKSTRGWSETTTVQVAAKGSAVMSRSFFDDEPKNDGMVTVFYMDGDRLLLTHYCEAGNQPTLVASSIDDEAHRVTFSFLNGTNLERRPGHMHSVVFRFVDDDHFFSRWSFFNSGQEQWFEDTENVRVK